MKTSSKQKTVGRLRVLVVDDHASAREAVAEVLRQAQYDVCACAGAMEALGKLAGEKIDVVVTDLQMPGMDGLEFIREIERRRHDVQVLMITAHASVTTAVEAMRLGAFDYIEKPFDAVSLEQSVARACDRCRLHQTAARSEERGARLSEPLPGSSPMLRGRSIVMTQLRERIAQVAATDETVLVCGESGTGKELVARTIHAISRRAN